LPQPHWRSFTAATRGAFAREGRTVLSAITQITGMDPFRGISRLTSLRHIERDSGIATPRALVSFNILNHQHGLPAQKA